MVACTHTFPFSLLPCNAAGKGGRGGESRANWLPSLSLLCLITQILRWSPTSPFFLPLPPPLFASLVGPPPLRDKRRNHRRFLLSPRLFYEEERKRIRGEGKRRSSRSPFCQRTGPGGTADHSRSRQAFGQIMGGGNWPSLRVAERKKKALTF